MRLLLRTALLLALVASPLAVAHPAGAISTKKVFVRYVVDRCPMEEGEPCTVWRLRLSDGRMIRLPDAVAPVATPHGSQVAYYRRSDGALVVHDVTTGKIRAVPGRWSPSASPLEYLSPAGRFAVVGASYQVVDTSTGQVHTLPFTPDRAISFSPDNAYLIARRPPVAGRPEVAEVFSTTTWTVVRRGSKFGALRTGGAAVAYIDAETSGKPAYIRFWDLTTDRPAGTPVTVPASESPQGLFWDRADHLDVVSYLPRKFHHGMIVRGSGYRWRRANDHLRILDTVIPKERRTSAVKGSVTY
ncbi:hypothetical protein HCN51_24350 [Nonomuraea sp. FMUSA5-5]|uniref:WD40 repeat domain-containing protein n=1 Tax=Nonomuraea composti TaxID=2720023 RepID=A0ABX1B9W3_9ACTN|nr:hypothetical protein [Nonomuraea sp. FMUSA5-5]NJP92551.1 hypothetical protein [Nonomuraea sp. FMUSA5-5]